MTADKTNPFIKNLVKEKFNLFNVDMTKCPVNKGGNKMMNWINKSFTELVSNHNYNSNLWGMMMGQQENGRHILSLDFDVFDKNAEDGVCKETKELLEKYLSNCNNKNGMYFSSTEGNMNVLVDYSMCDDIKEYVKKIGTAKFQKEGLEILLAGNQVIPPSQTNCKKTKQLGKPRTFIVPDQPFYVIENKDDFTYQFIISLFQEKLESLSRPEKKLKNSLVNKIEDNTDTEGTTTDEEGEQQQDKWMELLFYVIKNEKDKKGKKIITWDMWFKIAGIMKYNKYDRSLFIKYSVLDVDNEAGKLWDGIRNPNKTMSIYGLQNIAKIVNHQGYKNWLIKYNEFLHLGILEKGENDIARFIAPCLIISLVYCRNEWWEYNSKTCLWSCVKEPSATITTLIQRKIDEATEVEHMYLNLVPEDDKEAYDKIKMRIKVYSTYYSNACKSGFNNMIVKYLKSYLCDNDFYDNLDNGLYKMVYKNGILDLKTMIFKKGITQSDFITKTIPFDYEKPTEEELKYVRENLKKICNWNEKHLDYYLSSLGYAFTGDSSKEQMFWYLRGQTAENGKSIVFEVLEILMPNYVIKGGSDILDKGADLRKEISTWRGIKLLWLNEVSVKQKDEDLVKALCDGTGYKYNRLYSTDAIVMPIKFKLFAVSNNTLTIKGDAGVKRRFKLEQFNSQFKDDFDCDYENLQFKKDKDFKDKLCDQYKNALIHLILSYSNKYWNEKKLKEYPVEWNEEAEDVMKDNNQFSEWFKDTFEIKEGATIHKTDFETILNASIYKNLKIKDELARMKISYKYESQKEKCEKGKKRKGFWVGFKEREPEPEEKSNILFDIDGLDDDDLEV
jgi:hypothetical protein